MSVKEVCLIVVIAFITVGGILFVAPEKQKNAELLESREHMQALLNKQDEKILHTERVIEKLKIDDPIVTRRILQEDFQYVPQNVMVIQFKKPEPKTEGAK